jgi:hypothetical protein
MFVEQNISHILEEIRSLANCWLVIGPIGSKEELDAIGSVMNLSEKQTAQLTKFKQRECAFFCPEIGRAVHGYIPVVNRPC